MEGVIVNFRRARHHQKTNHIIIHVESITTRKDAEKLLNKELRELQRQISAKVAGLRESK